MLNLSKETKAVLLFGSVYRVRPSSLSSGCKWVKWHSEPLVPSCMWPVPEARLLHSLTAVGDSSHSTSPWRDAAELSQHSGSDSWVAAGAQPWRAVHTEAAVCSPVGGRWGGDNHISCTTESVPWASVPSSNTAFPTPLWFNTQCKEQLDWSHVREPSCNLLSEHETGSLRNNGINWGEVGALSFWHY